MITVARPPRDVLAATGADALSFLQSLVSQDLDALADGQSAQALLLTPQGKLDVDLVLLRIDGGAWLVCEGGLGERLQGSLNRFKIRVDVELSPRADLEVLAVRGADPRPWPGAGVLAARWPTPAYDVVGDAPAIGAVEHELVAAGARQWSSDEYERARIEAGVPRQGHDVDERTIPQEAFLEQDAVSFTKGCFLGQELVCRIDTRGHVNRYLRRLRLAEPGAPPSAEVLVGEKAVGTLTSVAGPVALATVRREVEPSAEVVVRWDGGETTATLEPIASSSSSSSSSS